MITNAPEENIITEQTMIPKTTTELLHELQHAKSIDYYIEQNEALFINLSLSQYLKDKLKQTKRRKSVIIRASALKPSYVYQIFSGLKRPTRDKFIALLIAMNHSYDDIQTALRLFGYAELYPKSKRDSYIIYALGQHMDVRQCNHFLSMHGEELLTEKPEPE